jgi:hypothetical protein
MARPSLGIHAGFAFVTDRAAFVLIEIISRLDYIALHATPCVYCFFK